MNDTLWQTIQNLPMALSQFHFLRPTWLLIIIPLLILAWWYLRQIKNWQPPVDEKQKQWAEHVDTHLLPYLIIGQADKALAQTDVESASGKKSVARQWLLNLGVFFSLIAAAIAIAGPTWQQKPVPAIAGSTPTMIVLSLAQSMNATDIKPTRLQRAVHKVRDILEQTKGDQRGLVIYSDMAFTASPLTNDSQVIQKMLPELSTNLMPVLGNRLDLAVDKATDLLQRGGAIKGNIIVLTDGVGDDANSTMQAAKRAKQLGYRVSVLGIGTQDGGILTLGDGRQVTDKAGNAVQTALDSEALADMASSGGGRFEVITASDDDVTTLLSSQSQSQSSLFDVESQTTDSDTSDWVDMGFLLLFIPMVLMPFAFKRGTFDTNTKQSGSRHVLMSILPILFCGLLAFGSFGMSQSAYADVNNQKAFVQTQPSMLGQLWTNLWQTTKQQAQDAFNLGHFERAAKLFNQVTTQSDSNITSWQASSEYKAGNYQQASKLFGAVKQDYNLGNALAKSGDLQGALEAYERYLKVNPKDEDAIFNRDLIKKMLEEQQQNNEQNKDDQQQDGQKNQDDSQDGQDGQQGDQSQQDQQESDESQNQDNEQQDKQNSQDNQSNSEQNQSDDGQEGKEAQDSDQDSQQDSQQTNSEAEDDASGNAQQFQPQPLDQATEQALRRVPDDSSGLLRARIMQYYQQQYLQQQGR